jgi:hypothetical protein
MITDVVIPMNIKGLVPVGSPIPWLKSYTNTPALPGEFVECNGQVLSDADSDYDGQTIPNLNGSGGGTKRFLRGSTTSGGVGGAEQHNHNVNIPVNSVGLNLGSATYYVVSQVAVTTYMASSLPSYYEVVYVLRVK